MIQNLFNNFNSTNIQEKMPTISSNTSNSETKTDFQKLFDKQNSLEESKTNFSDNSNTENNKEISNEKKDDSGEKDNSNNVILPNETFAGSVIYDIKELIAFLTSAAQKDGESSDVQEEEDSEISSIQASETESIEGTGEELDAEKIAKQILHLEDNEEEDEKKNTTETSSSDETETASNEEVNVEDTQEVVNSNNLLKNFEAITDETQTSTKVQSSTKEAKAVDEEQSLEDIINEKDLKELNIESIEAEMSDSDNTDSDLMKNQTAEEHGVKALIQGEADFAEVQNNTKPVSNTQSVKPNIQPEVNSNKIIEQITKQMESLNTGSRVNIVLNPESLGKVSIQLINTPEGLSAQFTVATQEARNLIMKGLDGLKDTLISHGVGVDNVSVKMNESQETEYNADWTEQEGSRGGNKEQGSQRGRQEKENFENMMSFIQEEEN